jgi:DNA topoisomerase-1
MKTARTIHSKKVNTTATYLVIVESSSKITKIESYLGPSYQVIATCGHICTLSTLKDIDIQNDFAPTYSILEGSKGHVESMRSTIKLYPKDCIFLATDNDREGEAIAFHICRIFNLPIKTTIRILFNEITREALEKSLLPQNRARVNMNMVHAQQARQVLDILIGFKISPVLWKYIYYSKTHALSAGRCQTPALSLIYENEIEHKKNDGVMKMEYKTTARFFAYPNTVSCELNRAFETPEEVADFLEQSKTHEHFFTLGERQVSIRSPPLPFNTSGMLQAASNILHYTPKTTNQLAQKLYQAGHITYIRTEAKTYAAEFLVKAEEKISERFSENHIGNLEAVTNIHTQLPHEAIRVTNLNIENINLDDDPRMNTLYKLIWKNTLQSCMSNAVYDTCKMTVMSPIKQCDNCSNYIGKIEVPLFMGWMDCGSGGSGGINSSKSPNIFYYQSLGKQIAPIQTIESVISMKGCKTHYTQSGLIKKLEELEIGRPSTYTSFIDTILEKGYVKCEDVQGIEVDCIEFEFKDGIIEKKSLTKKFGEEKNKLIIQPTGILCIEFLLKHFSELFAYDYTKKMEIELDKINAGRALWSKICESTYHDILGLIKPISKKESKLSFPIDENHTVIFQQYGPCIRRRRTDQDKDRDHEYEHLPIRDDLVLDMERLKTSGYTLDELVEYKTSYLGEYQEDKVYIRKGPYGVYLEWGENRKALKSLGLSGKELTFEEAIKYIDSVMKPTPIQSNDSKSQTIMRVLNADTSVRRGRFGPYIFHKTPLMKKPEFHTLKKFQGDFMKCNEQELLDFVSL